MHISLNVHIFLNQTNKIKIEFTIELRWVLLRLDPTTRTYESW